MTRSFDGFLAAVEARKRQVPDHKAALRRLSERSAARTLVGLGIDWAVVVGAAALSERAGAWWAYAIAVFVIATRMNAFYLEWLHEAVHGNLFKRKRWNDRADFLFGLPMFASVELQRENHLRHHRNYVEEAQVPSYGYEYWGVDSVRWDDERRLWWLWWVRPFTGYHTWAWLRDTWLDLRDAPRGVVVRLACFWAPVVLACWWAGALRLLAAYWLVPLLVVHPVLFFYQDVAQHFHVHKSPTRDVRGLVYRLIFNPHGRGAYHNLHHLHASVPWFRLAEANALFVDDATIEVASGFFELSRQVVTGPETSARTASAS